MNSKELQIFQVMPKIVNSQSCVTLKPSQAKHTEVLPFDLGPIMKRTFFQIVTKHTLFAAFESGFLLEASCALLHGSLSTQNGAEVFIS